MIELSDVSKIYAGAGGRVRALDGVSLVVDRGEYVAVRGPSGCGKSTMLALIGGLTTPTSGRVIVAGNEMSALGSAQRAAVRAAQLGFVFQLFHLLPYLSVRDNVLAGAAPARLAGAADRADRLLARFGLAERRGHRPGQLSAGERQRVAMARALVNEPAILLADEPTGNLDPESAAAVLDLIDQFHRDGGTVLLVTHDDRAADRAARVIHLRAGRLDAAVLGSSTDRAPDTAPST